MCQFWDVAVLVCGDSGMWRFWYVAVLVLWRFQYRLPKFRADVLFHPLSTQSHHTQSTMQSLWSMNCTIISEFCQLSPHLPLLSLQAEISMYMYLYVLICNCICPMIRSLVCVRAKILSWKYILNSNKRRVLVLSPNNRKVQCYCLYNFGINISYSRQMKTLDILVGRTCQTNLLKTIICSYVS